MFDQLNGMLWFEAVIEEHFPTREKLFEYLYAKDCFVSRAAIPILEGLEGSPIDLWNKHRDTYHKVCFAISVMVDTKSTGNVLFYCPSGAVLYDLSYTKGVLRKPRE